MDLLDRAIEDYEFIRFLVGEDPTLIDRLDKHIVKYVNRLAPTRACTHWIAWSEHMCLAYSRNRYWHTCKFIFFKFVSFIYIQSFFTKKCTLVNFSHNVCFIGPYDEYGQRLRTLSTKCCWIVIIVFAWFLPLNPLFVAYCVILYAKYTTEYSDPRVTFDYRKIPLGVSVRGETLVKKGRFDTDIIF